MKKLVIILASVIVIAGCTSTPPTKIGQDTYYSARPNPGGMFNDANNVAGDLMVEANGFCEKQKKEMELVTTRVQEARFGVTPGNAAITFRCLDSAGRVNLRPDRGISTQEIIQR